MPKKTMKRKPSAGGTAGPSPKPSSMPPLSAFPSAERPDETHRRAATQAALVVHRGAAQFRAGPSGQPPGRLRHPQRPRPHAPQQFFELLRFHHGGVFPPGGRPVKGRLGGGMAMVLVILWLGRAQWFHVLWSLFARADTEAQRRDRPAGWMVLLVFVGMSGWLLLTGVQLG